MTKTSFSTVLPACVFLFISINAESQNLFVSNNNGNIYELTPGGVQSIFASGVGAAQGLDFDSAGNLFVVNYVVGGIYKITPSRTKTLFASVGGGASGLVLDSVDNVFVSNFSNGKITETTPGGVTSTFVSGLNHPVALAFNSTGDLFEADSGSGNIYEFSRSGEQSTFASGLKHPYGLAFDGVGNLLVASESSPAYIYSVTPQGIVSTFFSGYSAHPSQLAFNNDGNLFATDSSSLIIHEFAPDGSQSNFASLPGGPSFLVFQPVPEPSFFGLFAVVSTALLIGCRRTLNLVDIFFSKTWVPKLR